MPNVDRALARLRSEFPLWSHKCAKIVDTSAQLVPFELYPWQLRLEDGLEAQRQAGKPQRAIILKARKLGFSTEVQAKFMHRCTLRDFQKALTVAHDLDTAGELFDIGKRIYDNLPEDGRLKPPLTHERDSKGGLKYLRWAHGSSYEVTTAGDIAGGRGYTPFLLHLSEIAWYSDLRALTSLLNAVPDTPETLIVQESTANGRNHFERAWNDAIAGRSGYFAIFVPWHEFPDYALAFDSIEDREQFEATIGKGEIGEDEPMLQERFSLTLEQLHWRRRTIYSKTHGDVLEFKQEYPAFPEEAFRTSGRHVFSALYTARVLGRVERDSDPAFPDPRKAGCPSVPIVGPCPACAGVHGPDVGILTETGTKTVRTRDGTLEVPTGAVFVPAAATGFNRYTHPMWKIWEHPVDPASTDELPKDERPPHRPGQYVIGNDVAGGEEMTTTGETAYHAICVLDHVTKRQVAAWSSRIDGHELTRMVYLAGIYWNTALVAVEITGGWGWPIVRALNRRYRYPRLYRRRKVGVRDEKQKDDLGWHTSSETKPDMEGLLLEQFSDGSDGIRDSITIDEATTYIYDEKGRSGPEADHFSDRLIARMIAGAVAREIRPRPNRRPGDVPSSSNRRLR